jgi:collagen triple helix repeat protein
VKSARVALGWPRLRRANGVDDVAAGVVGPAGCAGGPQNPGDDVAAAASSAAGLGDGSGPGTSSATGAVGPKTSTSAPNAGATGAVAPKTGMAGVAPKAGATGPRQRLTQALARGATLTRAAQEAGVSPQLAAVMVEQLRRSGSLLGATSLCASGLGACHSLEVDENTAIRCAGCPLSLKRTI